MININSKDLIKKAGHIILSLILLITTAGMTVTEHYCGDNLVSVNVLTRPDACCNNSDCCHNETVTVKLDDDFISLSQTYLFELISLSISLNLAAIFNNNPLSSKYLTANLIRSSDLQPPAIKAFLSKLGTFLL